MASEEDKESWGAATRAVRGGLMRSPFGEASEALHLTQSYVYETAESAEARFKGEEPGFIYTRYGSPTTLAFEERLALIEGAEFCRAAATGMAAIHIALMGLLRAGDHMVAARALFGSCRWILHEWAPRFGIEVTIVDGPDLAQWTNAVRPNTKAFFLESPTNPLLEVSDIAAIAEIAHAAGAKLVMDNAFASPVFQKPLTLGADVVVYSATKHIDGQGRVMGGAILGSRALLDDAYRDMLRHLGPAPSPFNSWVLLKGLETMELRVRAQAKTAASLADRIGAHPAVKQVLYPFRDDHPQVAIARKQMSGGSTITAFDLGSKEAAFDFLNALAIVDISNNLGDAKSMATHPATTTHRTVPAEEQMQIGLRPGHVRLSVGLEDEADLGRDIERALDAAHRGSSRHGRGG